MFAGVDGLATGTAAVLANAQPLLILMPAWWLYGERVNGRTAVGMLLGFLGLLMVALPGGGGTGAWLSVLAALAITGGTLLSRQLRSEEHTSELQSLMRISYAVFCLQQKKTLQHNKT